MPYLRYQYFDAMAHGKTDEEMARFHAQVDRLAMIICEELGLDPWVHVRIEADTIELTPYEARGIDYVEPMPTPLPKVFLPRGTSASPLDECVVVQPAAPPRARSTSVTRWHTFRRQAALLIAGHKALTKYLLTEA